MEGSFSQVSGVRGPPTKAPASEGSRYSCMWI